MQIECNFGINDRIDFNDSAAKISACVSPSTTGGSLEALLLEHERLLLIFWFRFPSITEIAAFGQNKSR